MRWIWAWLNDRPVRFKVLAPVVLAAIGIAAVAWSGLAALSAAGGRTHSMYAHTSLPLDDLATLRDMEGDARVAVRDLLLARPGTEQNAVISGMSTTDAAVDQALTQYVADHGSLSASGSELIRQARAGIATWRSVRDDRLVSLARAGDITAGAALLADGGALDAANNQFGGALDTLSTNETAQAKSADAAGVSTQSRQRNLVIVVSIAVVVLAAAIGLLVARAVVRPLLAVRAVLVALADGDLTQSPRVESRDEVGQMADALCSANAALRQTVGTIVESARTLNGAAESLAGSNAEVVRRAADSATQATAVAGAADDASESITAVRAGATEMGMAISEVARRAALAAQVAGGAVEIVTSTTATVTELGRSSADIEQVLSDITSIAAQTNLLALNATIEAARAGEAGKGFAVVAGEVKDLAQQTATATEDIARRIAAIQTTSGEATSAISRIGAVITEINDHQAAIAAAVEEQTATTGEMGRGVADAADASSRIASIITEVATAARATETEVAGSQAAVATVTRLSSDLRHSAERFHL
jgi:methyl-accepting chemotaxis protein